MQHPQQAHLQKAAVPDKVSHAVLKETGIADFTSSPGEISRVKSKHFHIPVCSVKVTWINQSIPVKGKFTTKYKVSHYLLTLMQMKSQGGNFMEHCSVLLNNWSRWRLDLKLKNNKRKTYNDSIQLLPLNPNLQRTWEQKFRRVVCANTFSSAATVRISALKRVHFFFWISFGSRGFWKLELCWMRCVEPFCARFSPRYFSKINRWMHQIGLKRVVYIHLPLSCKLWFNLFKNVSIYLPFPGTFRERWRRDEELTCLCGGPSHLGKLSFLFNFG